jgi:hypothetical protein
MKGKEILNANGILGTGICLDSACKEDMLATNQTANQLKQAQAQAITALSAQAPQNNNTIIIVVVIVSVIVIGAGIFLLVRKKKGI